MAEWEYKPIKLTLCKTFLNQTTLAENEIMAMCLGGLAYHPVTWSQVEGDTKEWGVTHIESGCRVLGTFNAEEKAYQFIEAVTKLIDWGAIKITSKGGTIPKGEKQKLLEVYTSLTGIDFKEQPLNDADKKFWADYYRSHYRKQAS